MSLDHFIPPPLEEWIYSFVSQSLLPDWDQEAILHMTEAAVNRWLPIDLKNHEFVGVEVMLTNPFVRGKVDLVLRDSSGMMVLVDWKTTGASVDAERLRRSRQLPLYASQLTHVYPVLGQYRILSLDSKNGRINSWQENVIIERRDAVRALREVRALRKAVKAMWSVRPWPRNQSGCRMYGRPCEFEKYCWQGEPLPEGQPKELELSYTRMNDFLRCPERLRLMRVLGTDQETRDTVFGSVLHSIMERIYKHAFGREQIEETCAG